MKRKKSFSLGANYWPSSSGPDMWVRFDIKEIENDIEKMKSIGFNTIRIFLRWQDFQKENYGSVSMDRTAVEKLDAVIHIAKKHNLKIIITLFVGWMSGVWYKPDFVAKQEDLFVNPAVLRYQYFYVKYFGERYKNEDAILAWDIANEQNVLSCPSRDAAYLWMSYLTDALRISGVKQPITTGINHMSSSPKNTWYIKDVSEHSDFNVIHPYPCPYWYPELSDNPLSIKTTLFPSFLGRYYEGIGKKPVMMEEFGTLGESVMDKDKTTPSYIERVLYSTFASGTAGALWWCLRDFECINEPPYEFCQLENDGLGIFDVTGRPKKFAEVFTKFSKFLKLTDYTKIKMPERKVAIVAPEEEDARKKLFASFVLCKMAKMEPDVIRPEDDFQQYKVLILPSVAGFSPLRRSNWNRMKEFIRNGNTIFLSSDGASLTDLREVFGIKVMGRKMEKAEEIKINFKGAEIKVKSAKEFWGMDIKDERAKVIGTTANQPVIFENTYGKGTAIFCRYPMERYLIEDADTINTEMFKVYQYIREKAGIESPVIKASPFTEVVKMPYGDGELCILVNHGNNPDRVEIKGRAGKTIVETVENTKAKILL